MSIKQIAQLNKDLMFYCPMNERNQSRDEVSGAVGINTACYPVLDSRGGGRRSYIPGTGNGVLLPTTPAYGTGDFSVVARMTVGSIGANKQPIIAGGNVNIFYFFVSDTGYLNCMILGGSSMTPSTQLLTAGQEYSLAYVRSSGVGTYYVNGIAAGTNVDTNNYTTANTRGFQNSYNGQYIFTPVTMLRVFNYALTAPQVVNYSKPEYAIEWADRIIGTVGAELITATADRDFSSDTGWWGKGAEWTIGSGVASYTAGAGGLFYRNGLLTPSKKYRAKTTCTSFGSGGSFRMVLGSGVYGPNMSASGAYLAEVTASSSNGNFGLVAGTGGGAASFDDISLVQLGCVLDLNAEGMNASTWLDKTNSLTATNSGCTFILPPASALGALRFDGGSISKIDFTSMNGLNGDITVAVKINPSNLTGQKYFLSSSGLRFGSDGACTQVSRDGAAWALSQVLPLVINTSIVLIFTSKSDGVTNLYLNGLLNGTANQSAGTPVAATTWRIGQTTSNILGFEGKMKDLAIWSRILSTDEIALVNTIL